MHQALEMYLIDNCDNQQALLNKVIYIFILEKDYKVIDSVTIYGNEIEDLIVARSYQHQGYGKGLLYFALIRMQAVKVIPITFYVADWNQTALSLYLKNEFSTVKTVTVRSDYRQQEKSI